jgi:hypothetical protein
MVEGGAHGVISTPGASWPPSSILQRERGIARVVVDVCFTSLGLLNTAGAGKLLLFVYCLYLWVQPACYARCPKCLLPSWPLRQVVSRTSAGQLAYFPAVPYASYLAGPRARWSLDMNNGGWSTWRNGYAMCLLASWRVEHMA